MLSSLVLLILSAADPAPIPAEKCGACHERKYARWSRGRHSRMIQVATKATVLGDFARDSVVLRRKRYGLREDAGHYFVRESYITRDQVERQVSFTLGSRRIQHYLTRLEDGRIVVLPPTWDVLRNEWIHNLDIVDAGESGTLRVQVWNSQCLDCHVSHSDKAFDPETGRYATTFEQLGTTCERCHGPGAAHVELESQPRWQPRPAGRGIVRANRLDAERRTMVCAQCHSLREKTAPGFQAGEDYFDYFTPVLEFAQETGHDPAYWGDGRPRRFSNSGVGFWQSACYLRGGATCLDCHDDPHLPNVEANPQLEPANNGLCTGCHAELGQRLSEHTRHRPQSAGSSCVECHMPPTVVSLRATMRDHTLTVPAPENSVRHGIPNACTTCHTDRKPAWAVATLGRWYPGGRRARLARRADAFVAARAGDEAALPLLEALARDLAEPPLIRANALGYLRRYPEEAVRGTLVEALSDPQPIVRMTAALGLSGPAEAASDEPRTALLEALHDERRVVRVAAMIALVQRGVGSLDGAQARHFARARDEYLERAAQYPEDSAMQLELGKLRFRLGEYGGAAEAFEAASRLEPDLAGASYFLGVARLGEQRIEEGRRLLKRVPRSDPYFDAAKRLLRELRDKEVSP